jgi:alpha/beta hydrolase family protein DUF900
MQKIHLRHGRAMGGSLATVIALCAIPIFCARLRADDSAACADRTTKCADAAAACCPQPRPQDEVWLVSSRDVGCELVEVQVEKLQVWRYDRERSWIKASLNELLATDDPQIATVVFLHGNRISYEEAFTKGWTAYRRLLRCAEERPVRFVIWSWPSEAIRGPINDARVKASRTNPAGYYLAWFLDQLRPNVPVSLWGHSFGARVATGALHLLGGGAIDGHRLDHRSHPTRPPMQAVLLAAALDNDWLCPGHCHGQTLSQVSGMLLVNNGCDALLKRYHLLYCRRSCAQALGYTGLGQGCLLEADWKKISQVDACCQVGRRHTFDGYIDSPDLMARMRPFLLFEAGATIPSQEDLATTRQAEAGLLVE